MLCFPFRRNEVPQFGLALQAFSVSLCRRQRRCFFRLCRAGEFYLVQRPGKDEKHLLLQAWGWSMCFKTSKSAVQGVTAMFGLLALLASLQQANAAEKIVTITNRSDKTLTLTDFISFSGNKNTGVKTTHLEKKDATDDINLAVDGKKNFDVGNDASWTVSWNNNAGKEVETDTTNLEFIHVTIRLAMFDSNFGGTYDLQYDLSAIGPIPIIGDTFIIDGSGHPTGTGFNWITFFDVTNSSTGFIERDSLGNAISPFLPAGTEVTASFAWSIAAIPEPSAEGILGVGLGMLAVLLGRRGARQRRAARFGAGKQDSVQNAIPLCPENTKTGHPPR